MEEVDKIIFINLAEIGVGIDEDVKSLADLTAEHVFQTALICLKQIDDKSVQEFPSTLPRGMSAKVGVTSELANVMKKNGYKGDLNYHQLLYPNPADLRKLLMWLIDSMPKKALGSSGQTAGEGMALDETIAKELAALLQESWTPHFAAKARKHLSHPPKTHYLSTSRLTYPSRGRKVKSTPGLESYYSAHLEHLTQQPNYVSEVAPSIFETNLSIVSEQREKENEWNTKGLDSNLNPLAYGKRKLDNIAKLMGGIIRNSMNNLDESGQSLADLLNSQQKPSLEGAILRKNKYTTEEELNMNEVVKMSEEEIQQKREAEIENLQQQLSQLQFANSELSSNIKTMLASIRQIEALINQEDLATEKLEKEYLIKKRTFDLLPNAEKNILQLQEICSASSSRIIELASKWEEIRIPLYEQYRLLRAKQANTKDELKVKLQKVKEMRAVMKELSEEIRSKDEKYRELLEVYSALQRQVTRSTYTDRILEIVKNVKKQKVDIDKILMDTRNSRKEINSVADTLNRTFTETDELIFQDAKKDNTSKDIYREVVNLNESFKKLIKHVEEIGQTRNTILTLESKIEQLQERTNSLNFDRLGQDLKEVKAENRALQEQLKAK